MVEIRPFRGIHYDISKIGDADKIVAPPHDVISQTDQEHYYKKSPYNIVRVILGKKQKGDNGRRNQYTRANDYLEKWLSRGVLARDSEPALYVLEQSFNLDSGVERRLLGIVARVKLEPFEKKIILPHEEIHQKAMEDRLLLTRACKGNMTFIMTLYSDPEKKTTRILEEAANGELFIAAESEEGVVNRVWAIRDEGRIKELMGILAPKKLYIADGHHRYTNALTYSQTDGKGNQSAQYMMMLLLNMDDENLTILSAQRVVRGIEGFEPKEYLEEIAEHFSVREFPLASKEDFYGAVEKAGMHAFGIYFGGDTLYLAKLMNAKHIEKLVKCNRSLAWKEIDAALLHECLIDSVLGVETSTLRNEDKIQFVKDRDEALALVEEGEYQMAFILNPTQVHQVKAVAENGERMPQKATYFYPKPLSGLLINRFE